MLLLAVLLQPACLLYTRMVTWSAAAECARTLETAATADEEACERFILRRLKAVPDVSVFHVGGAAGWDISLSYSEDGSTVTVSIAGRLRPLPLLGVMARAFGKSDGGLVVLETKVTERVRPAWFGGSYADWQKVWG